MIFEEAQKLFLVGQISAEMKASAFCVVMLQAIVEPLVVAEIKALLLQLPFQVPIGFSDEAEVRVSMLDRRNHVNPILRRRCRSCATTPGAYENGIQEQHRHIATHAVALRGYIQERLYDRFSQPELEGVELQDIRPCGKVWILSARVNDLIDLNVETRIGLEVLSGSVNEELWVLAGSGVIGSHMIGYEVQQKPDIPSSQFSARLGETCTASEMLVNHVAADTVG